MSQDLLPSRKVTAGKGVPPAPRSVDAAGINGNLVKVEPNAIQQINFKLSQAKKMEILLYANERGLSMTELLITCFDDYKARNL